jgi:hypothetical protein
MTTVTLDIPKHLLPLVEMSSNQLALILEMGVSRLAPVSTQAYMEAVNFLTQDLTVDMIASFRFSDEIESRINELLDKNRAGDLSKAEEVELDRLSQLEERLQFAKANALKQIHHKP